MIKTCKCVCYDITINTDTVFVKHMLVVTILIIIVRHQANHCITLIVFCFWSFTGTNTSMQGLLAQSHFLILQKQMMFSKFPNFTCSFIISSSIISSCWIRQGGSYAPQLCFSKLFNSIKVKNKVFELALICLYCFLILLLVTLFNFMSCFFFPELQKIKQHIRPVPP